MKFLFLKTFLNFYFGNFWNFYFENFFLKFFYWNFYFWNFYFWNFIFEIFIFIFGNFYFWNVKKILPTRCHWFSRRPSRPSRSTWWLCFCWPAVWATRIRPSTRSCTPSCQTTSRRASWKLVLVLNAATSIWRWRARTASSRAVTAARSVAVNRADLGCRGSRHTSVTQWPTTKTVHRNTHTIHLPTTTTTGKSFKPSPSGGTGENCSV